MSKNLYTSFKTNTFEVLFVVVVLFWFALLGDEQAWTTSFSLRSFDMDSVQVGKAVFVKESYTTLGIEPRTYSYPGRLVTILVSVGLKKHVAIRHYIQIR